MNNTDNTLIPELRFPEFINESEWTLDSLDKNYRFLVTNSFSRDNLNYEKGYVKNIHYGDIHTKFSTHFDIIKEKVPFINPEISITRINGDNYCKEGDIVFADASEDLDDVGKSIEIINTNNEKLLAGLHTLLARQIERKIVIGFGGYLFKSESIRKQIKKEAQGAKVLGISSTRISKINLYYPNSPTEQQKIADCLSSLDDLITAHTDKLDALKEHKKGLIQNLFPQEGETVPKWRFKEFEKGGDWTEKSLSKISTAVFDGTHQTPNYTEYGIPFYSVENIVSGNKNKFISKEDYIVATNRNKPEKGDVLITRIGKIGFSAIIDWDFEFSIYVTLACIKKDESFDSYFLHCFFQTDWYQKEIMSKSLLNAVPCKINMNELRETKVLLPPRKGEQEKIAECLSFLDKIISNQTDKIEQLKQHKKGLMQGLFPSLSSLSPSL